MVRAARWLVLVIGILIAPVAFVLIMTATPRFVATWQTQLAIVIPVLFVALTLRLPARFRIAALLSAIVVLGLDSAWSRNGYVYGAVIALAPLVCIAMAQLQREVILRYVLALIVGVTTAFVSRMFLSIPALKLQLVAMGEPAAESLSYLPDLVEVQFVVAIIAIPALAVALSWPRRGNRSPNEALERSRGAAS